MDQTENAKVNQTKFAEHVIGMFEAEVDAWRIPGVCNADERRLEVDDWLRRVASFTEQLTKLAFEGDDGDRSNYVTMLEKLQSLRSLLKYVV